MIIIMIIIVLAALLTLMACFKLSGDCSREEEKREVEDD